MSGSVTRFPRVDHKRFWVAMRSRLDETNKQANLVDTLRRNTGFDGCQSRDDWCRLIR